MGDFVIYRVVADKQTPQLMLGRSLKDIVEECQEWCDVVNSAEFIMEIDYITSEAIRFAKEGDKKHG